MPSSVGSIPDGGVRVARVVALLTGLAGFLLAVATPLLPVNQTTATVSWPQDGQTTSVEAPLISYLPLEVDASIPCTVFDDLPPEGGLIASTIPADSPDSQRFGLQVRSTGSEAEVLLRNVLVASQPLDAMSDCAEVRISVTKSHVSTEFTGLDDEPNIREGNLMPFMVGVFSELEGPAPEGLNITIEVDTRFTTTP
ncbi:arabinosyltransferase, partial [Hoyosella sp. YIM 151337]|nr:arabinosyltransferase [Hoyosella sp. YIM 151337]